MWEMAPGVRADIFMMRIAKERRANEARPYSSWGTTELPAHVTWDVVLLVSTLKFVNDAKDYMETTA